MSKNETQADSFVINLPNQVNMMKVFVLMHLNTIDVDREDLKTIGVYSSRASAEEAVARVRDLPGFCDNPDIRDPSDENDTEDDGFYIDAYELDQDNWTTGFVTLFPEDIL